MSWKWLYHAPAAGLEQGITTDAVLLGLSMELSSRNRCHVVMSHGVNEEGHAHHESMSSPLKAWHQVMSDQSLTKGQEMAGRLGVRWWRS